MAEIIINIKPDGTSTVDVQGWNGPSCSLVSAPYLAALGKEIGHQDKPEMHEITTTQQVTAYS